MAEHEPTIHAPRRATPESNEKLGRYIFMGAAVIAAIGVGWYLYKRDATAPDTALTEESPAVAAEPAVRHPIDAPLVDEPQPAPHVQDPTAAERVAELIGAAKFEAMLVPDDLVRRMVVTVDNLTRPKVATRLSPAKPVAGGFVALGGEDDRVIGVANFERYAPWIELIEGVRTDSAVALYKRLYPQFQRAYEDLGNPGGYFNDRMVEVIDHLLATPESPENMALTQPNVLFEFADPELEARSAGQKLLLRMGSGNAARVKAKLAEFRARIATAP